VFWINVPLGLAAMWLCNRALKLLPVRNIRGKIDYIGAALLTAGVTCFLLVLSWGGTEYPWLSPTILRLGGGAIVLFGGLIWHEQRAPDPILPPRLFKDPVFSRGVVLAFMTTASLLGTTFLLPLFFQLIRGADASNSGLLVMPFLVFNVIGAFTGGQLGRWLGRTKVTIVTGLIASCFGFAVLSVVGQTTPLAVVLLAMAVVGIGIGICMPSVLVMVQNAADRRDVGTATGALLFLRSLGGALGSTIVGALLTGTYSARLVLAGFPQAADDLGAIKPGGMLAALGPAAQAAGLSALSLGFNHAFQVVLGLMVVAAVVAVGLRDLPLRTVSAGAPEEPAALGH
jgi:MFS family permease